MKKEMRLANYLFQRICIFFFSFMLLVAVVVFLVADQIGVKTAADLRTETLNTATMHLQYRMRQVEEIAYSIVSNKVFTSIMRSSPDTSYDSVLKMREFNQLIDGYLFIKSDLAQINIYSDHLHAYPASEKHTHPDEEFIWHDSFVQSEQYAAWCGAFDSRRKQTDSNVITYVWKAENPNQEKVVYLEIELYVETLQNLMENRSNPSPYGNMLMILGADNTILTRLYSSSASKNLINAGSDAYVSAVKQHNKQIIKIGDTKYLRLSSAQTSSGYRIMELIPVYQLTSGMANLKNTILAAIVLLGAILFPVIQHLTIRLKQPLDLLLKGFGVLEKANFSVLTERSRIKEYDILIDGYNNMVLKLDETMQQLAFEQERKKAAELRALQSQINPHFLYNTLDMINWMAQEKGATDISLLTFQLSRLFRICLSNGDSYVPLQRELEHVQLYIQIQQTRFGRQFEYVQEVDPVLMECMIPKIILQPFVENAILHGFRENLSSEPMLRIYSSDITSESYCLVVEDNGQGIQSSIQERKESPKGSHLLMSGYGIQNVNERIQMNFGLKYGVELQSKEGSGTKVILKLPRSAGKEAEL